MTFGKNIKKPNDEKLGQDILKAQSNFTKLFTKPEASGTLFDSFAQTKDLTCTANCRTNVSGEEEQAMNTGSVRRDRFEARITEEQKELFQEAAALEGRSVTAFVVNSAQEAATRAIERHRIMTLSAMDQQVFVDALLNPPEPGKRLVKAAARYKRLTR